jgi:hypothetical protein
MKSKKIREENGRLVENLVASVRNRVPILENPEGLTDDIMNAISDNPEQNQPEKMKKSGEWPALIILRRLLAAASVCLFLAFAYEEYVVVEKISRLEKQSSAISRSSRYQAALNVKMVLTVLTLNPQLVNQYPGSTTEKIDLSTILKAAMFADAGGISPDDFKSLNIAGFNPPDQAMMSLIKNFYSTHYTIQK